MAESLPEQLGPLLVEQFREELNNLSAAVQLLTPVVREWGETRYDQYLAILNQSLYRMMRTMNHLEFLQLPEGEEMLHEVPLDLARLCRELAGQAAPLARHAGVEFSYEEEQGAVLTCGDGVLLRQMLFDLISNALRAVGAGGRVGLRLSGGRERVTLTVWDNGRGLEAEGKERTELLRSGGLGLGLPSARRIAQLHGGALVLEQQEDRGVRAVVSLPVRPPESRGALKTPQMGYDASGGFSAALVSLSDALPYQAFLPEDLE